MDQTRNRPSRPRLRTHANTARVLVFDQTEPEEGSSKMESDTTKQVLPSKAESKEAPTHSGLFFSSIKLAATIVAFYLFFCFIFFIFHLKFMI